MFKIDPKITEKDLLGKAIFRVLVSMNSHQVATPETSLEDARSYVFFFHEGKHMLSAYIGLHLLLTDRKLFYVNSKNPFKEDELSEVEDEARDFAEYLGAMLDEVDFAGMSDLEQDSWIEDQGIFSTKTQPEATPETAPTTPVTAPTEAAPVEQSPVSEVALVAPASQQAPDPVQQTVPAAEEKNEPGPPAAPVQPVPEPRPSEAKEQPREVPVTETVKQDAQTQTPPPAATKHHQVIAKEATTGIEMPPKQTAKKKSLSATSVVSRDREALARLLTSF